MMKVKMNMSYHTLQGTVVELYTEYMTPEAALNVVEDLFKTKRVKDVTIVDDIDHEWSVSELEKLMIQIESEPHHIKVYFDGGYDKYTAQSGLGVVIYYEQDGKAYRIRRNAKVDALHSNNEAEYAALHLATKELANIGVDKTDVKCVGDSLVVINQMRGDWASYDQELNSWANRIDESFHQLQIEPIYEIINRHDNKEADKLASQALQNISISSVIEKT